MKINYSTFTDKKEQMNALINSGRLQDLTGNEITIVNVVNYNDTDKETGEEKTITTFKTADGDFVGTVSQNVSDIISMCMETYGEITPDNPLSVRVKKRKSNNGRDFLSLEII